ncbi:MAG: transcriptional repressor LexA [Sediminispirochaetaceae bacterium]
MKKLTARQEEILRFICSFIEEHSYPPTMREIAGQFGISPKGAHDHVKALEKKGKIKYDEKRSRTIELLNPQNSESAVDETRKIPLLGNVAAGKPLFAEENFERMVLFPSAKLKQNGTYFALSVNGDSMQDAGILDGDTAVFLQNSSPENGDIVVARVDDEAVTLKRFYKEKNRVKLKAENPVYPPIYSQNVTVLGKLEHIIRSYN